MMNIEYEKTYCTISFQHDAKNLERNIMLFLCKKIDLYEKYGI